MMGRNRNAGKPGAKNPGKTFKRIMAEIMGRYKPHCVAVVLCLIVSAVANVYGTMFMQRLIDDYITPMIGRPDPDFGPMGRAVLGVALVYLLGAFSAWLYNYLMIFVSQGTLKNLRVKLFSKMERLPIKYFDTHAHGDIMSVYTNDIDTISEMINNSIGSLISSALTFVGIMAMMLFLSWRLTLITVAVLVVMLLVVRGIGSRSRYFFAEQQKDIGAVNGYIEEMIEGQKVIKVFNHEEKAKEGFYGINETYRKSSTAAQTFAGAMMPAMGNISHINYALTCCIGGLFAINGMFYIDTLVAFLQYVRQISQPVSMIAQQVNTVLAAVAGAERVFEVMEETPESLLRIVTQVNDPRLRLCLDVGHVNCYSSLPASQWMAQWGDALSHLHLHNNDASTDRHAALSRGSLDMAEIIRGIAPHHDRHPGID